MTTVRLFSAKILKDEKTSYNFYVVKDEQKYLLTALTKWYEKSADCFNENGNYDYTTFIEKENFWYPSLENHIIDCELEVNSQSQVVKIDFEIR